MNRKSKNNKYTRQKMVDNGFCVQNRNQFTERGFREKRNVYMYRRQNAIKQID